LETPNRHDISGWIKERALELGFAACGISEADHLETEEKRLTDWLKSELQGEMDYMQRHSAERLDPRILFPGAKSVISVLMNYFPEEILPEKDNYKIAKYAYGKDYHDVIRDRLNLFIEEIKVRANGCQARAFTDSAPVMDKAWAERSGLGWIGKNTCLIHPKTGSFVFVGEIITDLELEYDEIKVNDLCGGCTRCIDACPTGAIIAPRLLDARKCISYLTIEFKGELPADEKVKFNDWIFGCDICQDVCPWNRKSKPASEAAFRPHPALKEMSREKWKNMTEEQFREIFRGSAVKRTKFSGLKRNILYQEDQDINPD
jgi:epoxyqueuosine reductase